MADQQKDKLPTEAETQPASPAPATTDPHQDVHQTDASVPDSPIIAAPDKPRSMHGPNIKAWHVVAILLLLIGSGAAYYVSRYNQPPKDSQPSRLTSGSKTPKDTSVAKKGSLQAPKKLDNLNFFTTTTDFFGRNCPDGQTDYNNCPPFFEAKDLEYYQIGQTSTDKPIILVKTPPVTSLRGKEVEFLVAVQDNPSHYTVYGAYSSLLPSASKEFKQDASPNVSLDLTTNLPALDFPKTATIAGQTYNLPTSDYAYLGYLMSDLTGIRGAYFGADTPLSQITKINQTNGVTFYKVTAEDKSDFQVKEIYGVIDNLFVHAYQVADPLIPNNPDNSKTTPGVTWTAGDTKSPAAIYSNRAFGCGTANGYMTVKGTDKSQLSVAGKGPNDTTIYQLPTDNALFQDIYTNDYLPNKSNVTNPSLQNLSVEQFQANHGVIVTVNGVNELVAYTRSDLFNFGGCGKPVIYLYPTQPTSVSVAVGAEITKSDPFYPAGGWQSVLAQPSGSLTYQGRPYASLYWEGFGIGRYPDITSGTVVPYNQAAETMRQQLLDQGLNTKETSDFLDYWQPRIPTTPYVQLSWLDTAQMNALAPLQITPLPKTVLRVFLDMRGLQQPKSLPAQQFTVPARHGFTVVEWGGLL